MEVITFTDWSFGSNCYLAVNDQKTAAVLVDAGISAEEILARLEADGLSLAAILLTHGHPDHLIGAAAIAAETGAPCYLHELDAAMAKAIPPMFLRMMGIDSMELPEDFLALADGDTLVLADIEFKVLHTPGHSLGSVCFYADGVLFSGDLIFRGSIGRTDFPGGSMDDLLRSVKDKVFTLPNDTRILSGHMDATVVGWEKKTNPFLTGL
ncbi:MAG: MBL fold metallo-hydrolase [Candidatus Geothermincolia bacterium]